MRKLNVYFAMLAMAVMAFSCNDDDDATVAPTPVDVFGVELSSQFSIPAVMNRAETGNVIMELFADNTLTYDITVNNLDPSDELTVAHIHLGDVVTAGPVSTTLVDNETIQFNGNRATGSMTLSTEQLNALRTQDVYINVHSVQFPAGLLRGQIDENISLALNIPISPMNEVPAVTGRSETGMAYFRLGTNDLTFRVVVDNLDASDNIVAGHLHTGAAGVNGPVTVNLGVTSDNLGNSQKMILNPTQLNDLINSPSYVNIHSMQVPSGLLRGQIR